MLLVGVLYVKSPYMPCVSTVLVVATRRLSKLGVHSLSKTLENIMGRKEVQVSEHGNLEVSDMNLHGLVLVRDKMDACLPCGYLALRHC